MRSASVTGAPSAQNSGTTIDRIMCCTMCTLSSVVSYAARPELVAKKNEPIPPTDEGQRAPDRPVVAARRAAARRRTGRARRPTPVQDEEDRRESPLR